MHDPPPSGLLQFTEHVYELAQDAVPVHASKDSPQTYTQHQHIALICLKVREQKTYWDLVDTLIEMPRIRAPLDLADLPDFSTVCKAFHRLHDGHLADPAPSKQSLVAGQPAGGDRCQRVRALLRQPPLQ
jgi:hypothetical protein